MLPVIPVSNFTIKSKYLTKPLTLRPFLVAEESVLLAVKDSKDPEELIEALKQVVSQCTVSPKDFDVGEVPPFVLEYIFLKLRQNSNGEMVDLHYKCNNEVSEGVTCGNVMEFPIDLRQSDIKETPGHQNKFNVGGDLNIELKYPNLNMALDSNMSKDPLDTLAMSIKSIFSSDEVWLASDHTIEEIKSFLGNMTSKTKSEITELFFNAMPVLTTVAEPKCSKCGYVHKIEIEGLKDHFG